MSAGETKFILRESAAPTIKLVTTQNREQVVDTENVFGYEDREQEEEPINPAKEVRTKTRASYQATLEDHHREGASYLSMNLPYLDSGASLVGVPRLPLECDGVTDDDAIPNCGRVKGPINSMEYQYRG
jgi:hypothetical protein